MKVAAVMRQDVQTCGGHDTLNTAAHIMWEHDCGCVPVVDAEAHVVGMLTDRDVCMAAYTKGAPLAALSVGDTMSKTVCTCAAEDTLADAERIMRANQVHRLPVVDAAGRLVGILSLNDLAEAARHELAAKKRALTFAEVGETLEAVCRPRQARVIAAAA
jgi:CBS domain-containing protein